MLVLLLEARKSITKLIIRRCRKNHIRLRGVCRTFEMSSALLVQILTLAWIRLALLARILLRRLNQFQEGSLAYVPLRNNLPCLNA